MKELKQMTELELLQTTEAIIEELRRRGVVANRNKPIGDYTEWLVCGCMGLDKAQNNQSGFDATDMEDRRYQIKGRRQARGTVQFSPIRNLENQDFDFVIAVAFNCDYSIRFAVLIPHQVVPRFAKYSRHLNGHLLRLTDQISAESGVTDIRRLFRNGVRNAICK